MVLVNPFSRFTKTTDFFTKTPGFKGKGSWMTSEERRTQKSSLIGKEKANKVQRERESERECAQRGCVCVCVCART